MRFEWKIVVMALFLSLAFMFTFTYGCSLGQKTLYVYQVGIYKEEDNKNQKIKELNEIGINGYCYIRNNQYYVISMISDKKEDIEKHAVNVKGIMKTYIVPSSTTNEMLLESLSSGEMV